jgi:type IV pilus assembly protein PilV
MNSFHTVTARRHQRGISVIEVLIAVVVVSLGMLGIAGLQLTGMKQSSGGFNRSKATLYAEDIASRMRINTRGVLSGAYDGHDSSAAGYCAAFTGPLCDASGTTPAGSCSADQLAEFDLYSVSCGVDGTSGVNGSDLPNGVVRVVCDTTGCPPESTWNISVEWTENSTVSETAGDTDTFQVMMRLKP